MGTLVKITVYSVGEEEARRAFRAGFDRIRELDERLSDYKPDSELNRLTVAAVRTPTAVSADLFAVLTAAQELSVATEGAFDVTLGPVIRLWRDGRRRQRFPDAAALADASKRTGYRKLHVDERGRVSLDEAEMALDLGGIAKGYAAGEALAAIGRQGVRSAMVALSGDLAFSDAPPGARGWRIALHDETRDSSGVPQVLELANAALSTAGSAGQHLDAGGLRYSHIVDPRTTLGLTTDVTVTVIATSGLAADGLDTAISLIGVERGLALIDARRDAVAVIVRKDATGTTVIPSAGFHAFVKARSAAR